MNQPLLEKLEQPDQVEVTVLKVEGAEMDEMWSYVRNKKQERWLWHAIDHATGQVLAYVLASHQDAALHKLMPLLAPFSIQKFYTDGWGAYARILDEDQHEVGKHYTQAIERKHLTLRTRIKRLARNDLFFQVRVFA